VVSRLIGTDFAAPRPGVEPRRHPVSDLADVAKCAGVTSTSVSVWTTSMRSEAWGAGRAVPAT